MQQMDPHRRGPEVYYIQLDVISGTDLSAKDIGGKSDPFVKITVGDEERTTKVIKKTLNPEWKEKYNFKFFDDPKTITFDVLDKDITSDDKIGSTTFSLKEMFSAKTVKPFSGQLALKHKKKSAGTIMVRIIAQKLNPLLTEKIASKQQETIAQQSQQIDALSMQIGTLRQENASLHQRVESAEMAHPGSDGVAAASSSNGRLVHRPTPRQQAIEGANRFVELAMAKVMVLKLVMTKLMTMWQWVLRKCIYEVPVLGYYADLFVLFLGSVLRLQVGSHVLSGATSSKRPSKMLKLYEFEGDIECKMVRETLSALDLDCIVYPCPPTTSGGDEYLSRFMGEAKELCGGESVKLPVLVDDNLDEDSSFVSSGGDETCRYLMDQYGNNVKMTGLDRVRYAVTRHWAMLSLYKLYQGLLRSLPEHGNARKGTTVRPKEVLELFCYEASPFCNKVKEVMSALELPFVLKNVAHGSVQKRQEFQIRFGKKYPKWRSRLGMIQVPLLIDANTGREVFESDDIKTYLVNTYCTQSTA